MKRLKKMLSVMCMLTMLFCMTACSLGTKSNDADTADLSESVQQDIREDFAGEQTEEPKADAASDTDGQADGKVLVAYFSATGTTKTLAEHAADVLGADLYEIIPKEPYSDADLDYGDDNSRSTKEMNDDSSRPQIDGNVENMEQYSTILLGYPIWWGKAPRIVDTFIESYDFSGKTIVPFCTSGSSGIGSSAKELEELCQGSAKWLDGDRLESDSDKDDIAKWLDGLGLDLK